MRVDFYQLSRDPVEAVVAMLATRTLEAGERLLVVADDPARLDRIDEALWSATAARGEPTFLAHGPSGAAHAERQPILLAPELGGPANGARYLALADGIWRDAEGFERVFLIFDEGTLDGARAAWRSLGSREGMERHFWKQEDRGWTKAA